MRFQKRSSLRPLIYLLLALALTAGTWFIVSRNRPLITDVFPEPDAFTIPAPAPLRISFDRPMNLSAVEAALSTSPSNEGSFSWEANTLTFTPDQPWPRGTAITVTISTDARTSAGLRLNEDYTWSFRTAPTLLAYLWPATRNEPLPADLYVLDPETGDVARLTNTEFGVLDFSRSPDNLSILLSLSNSVSGADVAQYDLLTRSISILQECGSNLCANPQFDPTGRWIAYENLTTRQVFIKDGPSDPILVSSGRFPSWSTSGLLLYDPEIEAYKVLNPETGDSKIFPNLSGEPAAWSQDGSFFLTPTFTEIGQEAFASHILQYSIGAAEPINLTLERQADDNAPAVSLDGLLIAFARRSLSADTWTPGRQLWIMQSNGRNALQITNNGVYNHTALSWHPDNTRIAFVRSNQADLNESPEIWMLSIDGTPPVRLVINGFAPAWLP